MATALVELGMDPVRMPVIHRVPSTTDYSSRLQPASTSGAASSTTVENCNYIDDILHRFMDRAASGPGLNTSRELSLIDEIRMTMRKQERRQLKKHPADISKAWHLDFRAQLVGWMIDVCEQFRLRLTTVNIAVTYLDRVICQNEIAQSSTELVALACLVVAAKFEEEEEAIPGMVAFASCSMNNFDEGLLRRMESAVLDVLNWEMYVTTSAHFLETYIGITSGATFPEDVFDGQPRNECVAQYLLRYASYFQCLCLQDFSLLADFLPSVLAGAVLLACRAQLHVEPLWPPALQAVTGYSEDELTSCACRLLMVYVDKCKPQTQPTIAAMSESAWQPQKQLTDSVPRPRSASPKGPLENSEIFELMSL